MDFGKSLGPRLYFADTCTLLYNFFSSLPMRANREIVWGGCVGLGKGERGRVLMDRSHMLSEGLF